eukprot:1156962-Pelagomonas_calceolata.AAC.10
MWMAWNTAFWSLLRWESDATCQLKGGVATKKGTCEFQVLKAWIAVLWQLCQQHTRQALKIFKSGMHHSVADVSATHEPQRALDTC